MIELKNVFKEKYAKSNILQNITGNFGEAELDGGDLLPLGQHRDEDRFRHQLCRILRITARHHHILLH